MHRELIFKTKQRHIKTWSLSFHKTLSDGLELCELLVDDCDCVFIRCLESHSDYRASIGE